MIKFSLLFLVSFICFFDRANAQLLSDMYHPFWSPEGSRIIFASDGDDADSNTELYVVRVDGSHLKRITNDSLDYSNPVWSYATNKIIAYQKVDEVRNIVVMNPSGSDLKLISNTKSYNGDPYWSSDGTRIVYYSDADGDSDIYVMDKDGQNIRQLTNNTAREFRGSRRRR